MWAPLGGSPLDVLIIVAGGWLALGMRCARPALWQLAAIAGLALLTVHAARSGVWLVFMLVGPAAASRAPRREWNALIPIAAVAGLALIVSATVRGPSPGGASRPLLARALALAHGTPILADGAIPEQVALAGGRIWIGNPIDAFATRDQNLYLDWVAGEARGLRELGPSIDVVMVSRRSMASSLMAGDRDFVRVASDRGAVLFVRDGGPGRRVSPAGLKATR
jgi:hypothetical protein